MKQRKSILFLILMCCLCFVLMTGCEWFRNDQPDEPTQYNITIDQNIENGSIQCDRTTAKAGETITVTAEANENYQLVSITVNGEAITGNSFVMPEKDVVISATFDLAADLTESVPEDAIEIKSQSAGGASATGHITLKFGDSGLSFEAFVEDSSIVEKDGVAILLSRELPTIGGLLKDGKTVKVSVSAKGVVSLLATDANGELQSATLEGVTTSFGTWSKDGEKLDGYHVEIFVPYEVLGTTAETAKGSITVCPVIYSAYGSLPAQGASLEGVSEDSQNTYAVLTDDNTLRDNKYNMLSAQLGSYGSVEQGAYWDLSKDYYEDDAENYPNREALLTGHDNNDNNLVFYRVSSNEMYVKATLTVTGVGNPNDQWPKFGLMLFDGAGKSGLFMYVDAAMSGGSGNTVDNIVGTGIGYNRGTNNAYGSWNTAKESVFNLETKSIVMEMVYQDGWVHMYADGQFIKTVYYGSYNENLHFGIKSFGINLKVTDYLASDDAEADGWADKKRTAPEAQTVDILFAGDSYMDFWNWNGIANNLSYTGAKYANVGVGGTMVQYWIDRAYELSVQYVPSKIAFHISVNDIDSGKDPAAVLASLKEMFELYHSTFPDATIYWNSLVPNTMFASEYEDYKFVNAGVLEYVSDKDWLVYIDQTTSFELNGAARQDVFYDGLHFNIDIGYPLWANNMLTAMGYTRNDGTTMGDIDGYSHTGLWEFTTDENGKEYAYSYGNIDTALWFKNVSGENVYVEAVIDIGELRNGEGFPKFGLLVRNDKESVWGFIDAYSYPNQKNTAAGMVSRGVIKHANGFNMQSSWDWNTVVWGGATGCDFDNVKLAIAKLGNTVYFLVNDVIFATRQLEGEVVVGYNSWQLEVTITDVATSTDVDTIEQKLGLACADAEIDGVASDGIWTEEVLNNTIKFGDKGDGRYFTVAAVKGTDGVYFLVNTYTYENTRTSANWWENANIEFRFANIMDVQQYILVDGAGFNAVKGSGGITLSAIKALGNEGDIYHNAFEFFAPYSSFGAYGVDSAEIPLHVWGWVWDSEGWNNVMNVGTWPSLSVSSHGLRFERQISVSGANAGLSVDVQGSARVGDTVEATVTVAEDQTLDYVKIGDTELEVVDGKVSFVMPDSNVTIEVALQGIGVTSSIVYNSNDTFEFATVECETLIATVGQTVTFKVNVNDANEANIVSVKVNGEDVTANEEGVYSYVVKATDTAVAIVVNMDYVLSEQIDGVKGEGYGEPVSFDVEDGRSVTVYAKTDAYGVYFYVEAITNTLIDTDATWYLNHNFELYLNHGLQSYVNSKGESARTSKSVYNAVQQESGKYLNTVELYVNRNWITNFNAESVTLNYAFKAPGEIARYEYMLNNKYDRTDWWRTSHSSPLVDHIGLGTVAVPECIHITAAGIVHDCENAKIDGDFSEYEGKTSLAGIGNGNAKFDFTGYVADDGVYLGITIYQNALSSSVPEWHLNDNLEIQLLGDHFSGFSIIDGVIAGSGSITDSAIVRTYDENKTNGYLYTTKVELFYAYDCSSVEFAYVQIGVNGNGVGGWQSLIWDGNIAYITESGIKYGVQAATSIDAYNQVAKDIAADEGLTIDGVANEALYEGLSSVTYENINGATLVVTGKKFSTGILVLTTVNHTRPATDVIQGAGDAWWNFLDVEYRIAESYVSQVATSVFNNGDFAQLCATKAVTTDNGDGTYTTVFETFVPFISIMNEANPINYSGDVRVCIGGVIETGFIWVTGYNEFSNLYATENGFITK